MLHEKYMRRCLEIAQRGLRNASPNPSVGAVLVYQDRIIGEGFTSPFGGAHAEVNCLNSVQEKDKSLISSSSLYVSLEPCSHFGKTPPCSNLILEHKIPLVVIAMLDPNPLVASNGISQLKKHGVEVIFGILEEQAQELNKRFICFHTKKRPYVILKWAQTKHAYFSPNSKSQFWITNKRTKALVHQWRSEEMAILVGSNTLKADNPRLNVRLVDGKNPIRVVINTEEELDDQLHIFNQNIPSLIYSNYAKDSKENLEFIKIDTKSNVIEQILKDLYLRQVNSIIVEGGAYTLSKFIEQNVWDEARILTGAKELEEGIKAPLIKGKLSQEFLISGDLIQIYKNK